MIKVEFKSPINGMNHAICKGISSDLLRENVFLLQLENDEILEVYYKRIKHISSCTKKI